MGGGCELGYRLRPIGLGTATELRRLGDVAGYGAEVGLDADGSVTANCAAAG